MEPLATHPSKPQPGIGQASQAILPAGSPPLGPSDDACLLSLAIARSKNGTGAHSPTYSGLGAARSSGCRPVYHPQELSCRLFSPRSPHLAQPSSSCSFSYILSSSSIHLLSVSRFRRRRESSRQPRSFPGVSRSAYNTVLNQHSLIP